MAEACKLTAGSGQGKGLEIALTTTIKGSLQGKQLNDHILPSLINLLSHGTKG